MTATGPIATFSTIVGGSGYYNNTYATVRLLGGNGSLAYANITVSGGAVTAVALPSPTAHQQLDRTGKNYQVGDVLSLYDLTALGPGSGFTVSVATLVAACENCIYGKIVPYTSAEFGGQRFCSKEAYANIAGPKRDYESVIVPDDYFCGDGADNSTGASFSKTVVQLPSPIAASAVWNQTAPAVTSFAGSFTSVSAVCRYTVLGKLVAFSLDVAIVTNNTASGYVNVALPVTANAVQAPGLGGFGYGAAAFSIIGTLGTTLLTIYKADGTYPGADNTQLTFSGVYESA